jgi:transcriptional regulator with XRE-family HTH domain
VNPSTSTRQAVAGEVRAAIARHGDLTQQQLADAIEMGRVTLSDKLRGRRAFNVDELAKIAAVLDVDFLTLFPAEVPA